MSILNNQQNEVKLIGNNNTNKVIENKKNRMYRELDSSTNSILVFHLSSADTVWL